MKTRTTILLDWILILTFCTFIFSNSSTDLAIWGKMEYMLGGHLEYIPDIFVGSIPFFLLFYAIFIRKQRYILCYAWLIILALLLAIMYTKVENPYDKIRLAGYFIMSFLFFRVLHRHIFSQKLYFLGAIFSTLIAVIDETSQLFLTCRVSRPADIGSDFVAVLLGQLSIALIIRPKLEKWRFKLKQKRIQLRAEKTWLNRRKEM